MLRESLKLEDQYPTPTPEPGSALIRPTLVGICKTDLELTKGYMGFQGVLGHEFVGLVEECDDTDWVGKRVVGEINCSPRDEIVADPRHQPSRTVLGIDKRDGAMADRFLLPVENLLEVPESLSDRDAVFTEPLAAAFQIIDQMDTLPETALVMGDGKLGALCALALQSQGCQVVWQGKHPSKLQQLEDRVTTRLASEPSDTLFALVVEATGSPQGLEQALAAVKPRGTIVLKTTVALPHQLDLSALVINEVQLLGSRCGRFAPALKALAEGEIDPGFLIEAIYPVEQALVAFEHAARPGAAKILLNFD